MAKEKSEKSFSRYFVFVFIAAFFVIVCINVYSQSQTLYALKEEEEELKEQIAEEEEKNSELSLNKEYYTSDAYIEKVARERLGLIMPDEIEFVNTAEQ